MLVLTPTRELAVQIDDDVQGFGYHAGVSSMAVYGGAPMEPQSRALAAGIPFVVATPGRLMDHMRSGTEVRRPRDAGPRRSRPHARHGLLARRPAHRRRPAGQAPDAALLGHDAERDPRLRARHHDRPGADPGRPPQRRRPHHQPRRRARPDRREDRLAGEVPARRGRAQSWCSSAPSAAPTSWPRRWPRAASATAALHADRTQKDRLSAVEGFKSRPHPRPRRHRHRRARPRHRRHHPRRQLRRAALGRGLRPPRRPHRPRARHRPRADAGVAGRGARAEGRPRLARAAAAAVRRSR